jgi:hypothetical protein
VYQPGAAARPDAVARQAQSRQAVARRSIKPIAFFTVSNELKAHFSDCIASLKRYRQQSGLSKFGPEPVYQVKRNFYLSGF